LLWSDAVRWAARPVDANPLDVRAEAGPSPTVSVDTAGAAVGGVTSLHGTVGTQHVRLVERAPALYSGPVAKLAPGVISVSVAGRTRPVAVSYPAEYRPQASRLGSLGEIVASAGGRLLGTSANELSAGRRDWTSEFLIAALALYAAGVVSATWPPARRPRRTEPRAAERR
jgi:hypothetical protein